MFFKKEAVADLLNINGSEGSELKEIKQSIIHPLEPFIVNLMDKSDSGKRYLKTTIELDVMGQEGLDLIESRKAQLRDAILLLLTSQSFMEINTIEGKLELKRSILLRINQVLSEKVVNNIYFTEFVVQ
jgi:flagellar FliL protein